MSKNKQLAINMTATIIAFFVNMGISFVLSPIVVEKVGTEANGFVLLANNFVNYASLITIALNSMAGRFITIAIHQNKIEEANKYFNSVLITNIVMGIILLIPTVGCLFYLDHIINIPSDIVLDVKLLFFFIFVNFITSIIDATFSISTFAKNRLDLASKRKIESNILKAILLITAYTFFKTQVFYIGVISLITTIYITILDIHYTKKLLGEVSLDKKFFDISKVIQIIKSGMWNVITKLGQILNDGLDLLLSNWLISPLAMGQLALAKIVSTSISSLVSTVSSIFQPTLTISFAKEKSDEIKHDLINAMKITGTFSNIVLCGIIVFGLQFYKLWVPSQDAELINILTTLTVLGTIVGGVIDPLWGIFTITNKLKVNSIVILCSGFINTLIVFILLKTTNLGVFAIAGVSSITSIIRNLTFTPMYSAHCLGFSKKTFYPVIMRYIGTSVIMLCIFYFIFNLFTVNSWFMLILVATICGIIGLTLNILLLFGIKDSQKIITKILEKVRSKQNA